MRTLRPETRCLAATRKLRSGARAVAVRKNPSPGPSPRRGGGSEGVAGLALYFLPHSASGRGPGGGVLHQPRPALTLIEMLVVLTILAVLTTLTVALTEGTVEQARFDATQRQLRTIQDAVVGPAGQPDAPSFVGDTGRLPLGHLVATGEAQPVELWANPGLLPAFALHTAAVDGNNQPLPAPVPGVLSGWRGPYVVLPPGQTRLLDGWATRSACSSRTA